MECELCSGTGIERWRVHYCSFAVVCPACGGSGRYTFVHQGERLGREAAAATRRASIERPAVAPPSRFLFDPAVLYPTEIPPYALGPSIIPLRGDRS